MSNNEEIKELKIKIGSRIQWQDRRSLASNLNDLGEVINIKQSPIDKNEYWIETEKGFNINLVI